MTNIGRLTLLGCLQRLSEIDDISDVGFRKREKKERMYVPAVGFPSLRVKSWRFMNAAIPRNFRAIIIIPLKNRGMNGVYHQACAGQLL